MSCESTSLRRTKKIFHKGSLLGGTEDGSAVKVLAVQVLGLEVSLQDPCQKIQARQADTLAILALGRQTRARPELTD